MKDHDPVRGEEHPAPGPENPSGLGQVDVRIVDVLEHLGRENGVHARVLGRKRSFGGDLHGGVRVPRQVGADVVALLREEVAVGQIRAAVVEHAVPRADIQV
jgi:hypothetical protein